MAKGSIVFAATALSQEFAGEHWRSWPHLDEAERRVLTMQTELHEWAKADPGRRFDDLFNLVYDLVGTVRQT